MVPEGFCDVSEIFRSGVYLLLWKDEVVYVGQSTKIHSRIHAHILGRGKRSVRLNGRTVRGPVFDRIAVMAVALSDLDRVERELIERYIPRYNEKHKPKLVVPLADLIAQLPIVAALPPQRDRPSWRRV